MEYTWGFGAVRTPLSADFAHHLQDIQHGQGQARDETRETRQLAAETAKTSRHRSNSSPGTLLTKRRGLFGHSRSASTSTSSNTHDREVGVGVGFEADTRDDARDSSSTDSISAAVASTTVAGIADGQVRVPTTGRPPLVLPLVGGAGTGTGIGTGIGTGTGTGTESGTGSGTGTGLVGRRQQKKRASVSGRLEKWASRMPASGANKYYQTKQLPATPRFEPDEPNSATADSLTTASSSLPASRRGGVRRHSHLTVDAASSAPSFQHAAMPSDAVSGALKTPLPVPLASSATANASFPRAESISSASGQTTLSTRTMQSSDHAGSLVTHPSSSSAPGRGIVPFMVRHGRSFVGDPTLPYPLPVDLAELHRQSLRTLMLFQLFGGPVCSPEFEDRPPLRVLEVGCGSAFWSMMCFRYYRSRFGDTGIHFTGLDIAPIAPGAHRGGRAWPNSSSWSSADTLTEGQPDRNMRWRFVQHDLRRLPWPLSDDEYDLVMVKDMSLATSTAAQQSCMDECLRVLAPGGIIEIWESDHAIRLLRPHMPEPAPAPSHSAPGGDSHDEEKHEKKGEEEDEHTKAASIGAYVLGPNTPLSAPANPFLVEYNGWLARALEARCLSAIPCTLMGPLLWQEAETVTGIGSRRLAVPLSEVRWEREGVGGVVTKNDGKTYIETKGGGPGARAKGTGKPAGLDAAQAALRRTALVTVVHMVQSLEHVLREVSGKSQDEWDGWLGKMTNDLLNEDGTSWGECLEVGAWWAKKRTS